MPSYIEFIDKQIEKKRTQIHVYEETLEICRFSDVAKDNMVNTWKECCNELDMFLNLKELLKEKGIE